jgi:hypothetical protein
LPDHTASPGKRTPHGIVHLSGLHLQAVRRDDPPQFRHRQIHPVLGNQPGEAEPVPGNDAGGLVAGATGERDRGHASGQSGRREIGPLSPRPMPSGVTTLGQLAAQFSETVSASCNRCDRRGTLRTPHLLTEHGPNLPVPELRRILAADCPKMTEGKIHDVWGNHFPGLAG